MNGERFHKISCIFDAIDLMATENAYFEWSRAVIEKRDLIIFLIVVWSWVRAHIKYLMVNGRKDGEWRALS